MSTGLLDSRGLHLPDLVVRGFRGIEDLTISRLGRVNLISGKNSVGKTTLLEAIRVYAARGRYSILSNILRSHEELTVSVDEDGDEILAHNWEALFHGRHIRWDEGLSIGPQEEEKRLGIKAALLTPEERTRRSRMRFAFDHNIDIYDEFIDDRLPVLRIEFQGMTQEVPMDYLAVSTPLGFFSRRESDFPAGILYETLGPGLPSNASMARFWDRVALTDDENQVVRALNLIFGGKVERIGMIGDETGPYDRRAVARMAGASLPVPLKSLGDGAVRLFGFALALANSQNGFLIVDEVENGIHYSIQHDFWKMVIRTAHENNVQIFATTHSWDCVRGFAQAAAESEAVEGTLVRLYRKNGNVRAIEYSENDLKIAAEQSIEVR